MYPPIVPVIPEDASRELIEWSVKQDAIYGHSIESIAMRSRTTILDVEEILSSAPEFKESSANRKRLALARLDLATKALMPQLVDGNINAIHTYLKIQEREAKLTGMDREVGFKGTIKIEVPWLTSDRLSYQRQGQIVDNVTDITPILDFKKAAEAVPREPKD